MLSVAENVDICEGKTVFEANFSHVYHILYESFVEAESHLRQRGEFTRLCFPLSLLFTFVALIIVSQCCINLDNNYFDSCNYEHRDGSLQMWQCSHVDAMG